MKTRCIKANLCRWTPYERRLSVDTISLGCGETATLRRNLRQPLEILLVTKNDTSESSQREGESEDANKVLSVPLIERRWSCADKDFDLGKYYPDYVKRLMELLYREIHLSSREMAHCSQVFPNKRTEMTLQRFAQANVVGAAVAFLISPKNPNFIKIAKDIAKDFPTLDNHTMPSSLPPGCWSSFVGCIKDNAVSLEVFAKVRGLETSNSMIRIAEHMPPAMRMRWLDMQGKTPNIIASSDCAYVVADRMDLVKQPMYEGFRQVNIRDSIYNSDIFAQGQKPDNWPEGKIWPSDPTLREPEMGICRNCESAIMCHCDPRTSSVVNHPLVELKVFGSKGRGIRALQRIGNGDLLDEYVGVIKHADNDDDPVYSMVVTPYMDTAGDIIGTISAKRFGNWTRFINHSCSASAKFVGVIIGNRLRTMVKAIRDIEMFEELTVHYGDQYWADRYCECGESCCKLSYQYAVEHCLEKDALVV